METMINDRLLTSKQAAAYLSVSQDQLRRYLRMGKLPALKFGNGPKAEWRIRESNLNAMLRPYEVSNER